MTSADRATSLQQQLGELETLLGIRIVEAAPARVKGTMPVEGRRQTLGLLHGGATAAFAESLGSWAALLHAESLSKVCVGLDLNITHHRGIRSGLLRGTATPLHLGRRITSHEVRVVDDDDNHVATARITNLLVDR